jgi:hypothetical protein
VAGIGQRFSNRPPNKALVVHNEHPEPGKFFDHMGKIAYAEMMNPPQFSALSSHSLGSRQAAKKPFTNWASCSARRRHIRTAR